MTVNRLAPRPPPSSTPSPLQPLSPRVKAPAEQARPLALNSKDSFQPASSAKASVTARRAADSLQRAPQSGGQAPRAHEAAQAKAKATPQAQPQPAGFFDALGQGLQNLGQGIQDFAEGVVQGATDIVQDTAQAVQQGANVVNNVVDIAVHGTGNFAPDPAPGFATTPPGTPLPAGARPVQAPQPTGVPDVSIDPDDGWIIGAGPTGPTAYPPNTPPSEVHPITPEGQDPNAPRPTIIFTNGILTNSADQAKAAQQLANETGANVICVHNGTNGGVVDVSQAGGDILSLPGNPATHTLTNLLTQAAQSGQPVHVAAHSQGGIITSDALQQTKDNLSAQGLSDAQIEQIMGNFHVQTFGGAAPSYPSGPHYTHVVHPGDPVSGPLGMGNPLNAANAIAHGQEVIIAPNPGPIYDNPFNNHDFSGYAPQADLH